MQFDHLAIVCCFFLLPELADKEGVFLFLSLSEIHWLILKADGRRFSCVAANVNLCRYKKDVCAVFLACLLTQLLLSFVFNCRTDGCLLSFGVL